MITVSLVILTWNRKPSVAKSLRANIDSADYPIKELIHVDNGSEPGFTEWFKGEFNPAIQVCHASNLGVAKGYNHGFLMATSSHVALTGCDRVMPSGWLKAFANCLEKFSDIATVSCYTGPYLERRRGNDGVYTREGIKLARSIPVEARMHSREFLLKTGYWREDFGTYGYEDSEWSNRAERTAKELGLANVILPSLGYAAHLPDDDFPKSFDGKSYNEYKKAVHSDPWRKALWEKLHLMGSPYYNPYSQIEKPMLEDESPLGGV